MNTKILQVYNRISEGISPMRAVREALNLTQQEFAERMKVAVSTVHRWESGKSKMTLTLEQIKRLDELLRALDMTFQNLPDDLTSE